MRRVLPWAVAAILLVAFAASFSELQRMRKRFGEVTRHTLHDHQDVRAFIIRADLDDLDQPVVVLGDSIAEMARLPATICGHPVVNAGIGGATSSDFLWLTAVLLKNASPSIIVIAIGANDHTQQSQSDFARLVAAVQTFSAKVIVVPTTTETAVYRNAASAAGADFAAIEVASSDRMADGIHLNRVGYQRWTKTLVSRIASSAGCADMSSR